MKIHEIKEMKSEELVKQIEEETKNLVDLKFSHQLKQLTNTGKLKLLKKNIARMKTVLKERELEVEKSDSSNKKGAEA